MSRIVTGLSHSLVSECSLFLLVVPAHPLCHWTVVFPKALLWICYYTCFLLSHWWHKTIGWRRHNVSFHLYADNTLLYISFESSILGDLSMARAHSTLESCAHDADKCLLYINDGETEMLIIHAHAKDRPALLLDKLLQRILELFSTRCFHLTITLHKFADLLSILLRDILGIVQKVFKFPAGNILVFTHLLPQSLIILWFFASWSPQELITVPAICFEFCS